MDTQTRLAEGNRSSTFCVDDLQPGDELKIQTSSSAWYIVRTRESYVTRSKVRGIMVQTDSTKWGTATGSPSDMEMDRVIHLGERVDIGHPNRRPGQTRSVRAAYVNGRQVL